MILPEKHPSKGILTFLSEGNNNSLSKNFSRKMRINDRGGLVIGHGYHLDQREQNEVLIDLRCVGVSEKWIEVACDAVGRVGLEAIKYLKGRGLEFSLTEVQDVELFERIYEDAEEELKDVIEEEGRHYGGINLKDVPYYQKEILVDFAFTEHLKRINREVFVQALYTSQRDKNPRVFDKLVMDTTYWRSLGLDEDRIRYRCIFIREWKMITIPPKKRNLGMSDEMFTNVFMKSPNVFSIEGFFINKVEDDLKFVMNRMCNLDRTHNLEKEETTVLTADDLIGCIKLLFDNPIDQAIIGLVMEPKDILNGQVDDIKPIWYPDNFNTTIKIKNMEYADVFIEAVKTISQLSSGQILKRNGYNFERGEEYVIPDEVRNLGIYPIDLSDAPIVIPKLQPLLLKSEHKTSKTMFRLGKLLNGAISPTDDNNRISMMHSPSNGSVFYQNSKNIVRFWLKVANVIDKSWVDQSGEYYIVKDVHMILEARKIIIGPKGIPEEVKIDDQNDPYSKFASKFNLSYNQLSNIYPCLYKLKQIVKGIAMACWLKEKRINLDMKFIDLFYNRKDRMVFADGKEVVFQRPSAPLKFRASMPHRRNMSTLIPKLTESSSPKTIDAYSPSASTSITLSNSKNYHRRDGSNPPELLNDKKLLHSSLMYKRRDTKIYSFAGIMLNYVPKMIGNDPLAHLPKEQRLILNQVYNEQPLKEKKLEEAMLGYFAAPFPFNKILCSVCENRIGFIETTFPINGKFYCRIHHPQTCSYCFAVVVGNHIFSEKEHYHYDCLVCRNCQEKIEGKCLRTQEGFVHKECMEDYLVSLCKGSKIDLLFDAVTKTMPRKKKNLRLKKIISPEKPR